MEAASSQLDLMAKAAEAARVAAGGPSELARRLNAAGKRISPQAVGKWERVPAERVLDVEAVTGVSRHDLRPDLYGPAKASEATHA